MANNFKYEWRTDDGILDEDNNEGINKEIGELMQGNREDVPLLGNGDDDDSIDNEGNNEDHYNEAPVSMTADEDNDNEINNDKSSDDGTVDNEDGNDNDEGAIINENEENVSVTEINEENVSRVAGNIDEVIVEDVEEDDDSEVNSVEPEIAPPRNRTWYGLRSIKNPPRNHRNIYEREFNYLTTSSGTKNETRKSRRDPQQKWVNNKKKKRRATTKSAEPKYGVKNNIRNFMDIIMTQVSNDDTHAQISVKEGLKRHGDRALQALLKEFGQIHKYNTFDQQHVKDLTPEMKKEALNLITMIKGK